ncbi:MAG: amidophosphoribosyltransferase, partial [Gammaproteobacteria bacterium]|nr:amidophosphoribosyltransferase [Gammaproteobacteria bacterium]NIO61085.1 amidophosphoribosyltransferase [Gammaproteobacteria bacterium]
MCGIIGIVGKNNVNQAIYDGLTFLQHRGQDAAGMVTCAGSHLYMRKNNGLVRDVFHTRHMLNLKGNMGIGHVRYPTAGCSSSAEAQPFYVNSPYGITLAHNGNLTNGDRLKEDLVVDELRHLNTESDSEILLNILAYELQKVGKLSKDLSPEDIFSVVSRVHKRCRGGYAAVALITGLGILAFRDPYGIRPVAFGERTTELGREYIVASESVAIDALEFTLLRDV